MESSAYHHTLFGARKADWRCRALGRALTLVAPKTENVEARSEPEIVRPPHAPCQTRISPHRARPPPQSGGRSYGSGRRGSTAGPPWTAAGQGAQRVSGRRLYPRLDSDRPVEPGPDLPGTMAIPDSRSRRSRAPAFVPARPCPGPAERRRIRERGGPGNGAGPGTAARASLRRSRARGSMRRVAGTARRCPPAGRNAGAREARFRRESGAP